MKALTKKQQQMADEAVTILHKLQDLGVEIMYTDGGGGGAGLNFWRPTDEERQNAYDIIAFSDNVQHEEFLEKNYYPSESIGLRIDVIVP